jgi:sigma-E factor negative regulatory protein RseC
MSGSIEARAEVVRVEGERAWVRLVGEQGGCGRCHEPGGCGGARLTDVFGVMSKEYVLEDSPGLEPGERVKLVMEEGVPLRMALSSYGLGTVSILFGGMLGTFLTPAAWSDLGAGLGALAGGALAVLGYRRVFRAGASRPSVVRDGRTCARRGE